MCQMWTHFQGFALLLLYVCLLKTEVKESCGNYELQKDWLVANVVYFCVCVCVCVCFFYFLVLGDPNYLISGQSLVICRNMI